MIFERISQPVEVLVVFRDSRPEPMMFRWANKYYQVRRIQTIYAERQTLGKRMIFSVSDDRDIFRLSFQSDTMKWQLEERASLVTQE